MSDYGAFASNRDKTKEPRLGKGWCKECDRALVGHGAKCVFCGTRNGLRRFKKIKHG